MNSPSTKLQINSILAEADRLDNKVTSTAQLVPLKMRASNVNFYYGAAQALHNISLDIRKNKITALIGPSGCGKSTFLRNLNRLNETVRDTRMEGEITLEGRNIREKGVSEIRRRIGMVFQRPNPFPKSIFENVIYGPKINGILKRGHALEIAEKSLRQAALWDEVKDRLSEPACSLSGGQQQRLCIARALAAGPEVLLLDEPCSALDPLATAKVENLLLSLDEQLTIVIVTHNMQQAARVAETTGFFMMGKLIEHDKTEVIFKNPSKRETQDYISGRFG